LESSLPSHCATGFFADHEVRVERVMTDNAMNYVRARPFQVALDECV
jgi:hypothetical protein